MIASVRGPVAHVGLDHVVVEVGGVGMLVHTTPATASTCHRGSEASLATSLVVREDSLTLFGFSTPAERDMFEVLQTVSGVGPRLALAMLSVLTPDEVSTALRSGDLVTLTKIPGVGKKSAERLVLELKRDADPEIVLNQLYQFSPLQDTFSLNFLALVDGKPRVLPLKAPGEAATEVLMVATELTEQRAAEQAKLDAAIAQRDMLVKEVHHRIKNNLQGVAGLMQQTAQRRPEVGHRHAPDLPVPRPSCRVRP